MMFAEDGDLLYNVAFDEGLSRLIEMDFPPETAWHVLEACKGNLDLALNVLFDMGDNVQRMPPVPPPIPPPVPPPVPPAPPPVQPPVPPPMLPPAPIMASPAAFPAAAAVEAAALARAKRKLADWGG